jgi:hypothetical protein
LIVSAFSAGLPGAEHLRENPTVRRDLFVVTMPGDGDERFAILWRDRLPIEQFVRARTIEDVREVFQRCLASAIPLTEAAMRGQLAQMGLPEDDIDDQIDRARSMQTGFGDAATRRDVVWESTTQVGYRNAYGQELTRKTSKAGVPPFQRIFAMKCGACGHEYGANGSEVHSRRCPACQGGPAGVAIEIP